MTPPPDPICVFFGVVVPPVDTPSLLGNCTFLVSSHDSPTHSSRRLLTRTQKYCQRVSYLYSTLVSTDIFIDFIILFYCLAKIIGMLPIQNTGCEMKMLRIQDYYSYEQFIDETR